MSRTIIPPFPTVGILLACVTTSARAEQNKIDDWIELVYDLSGVIKCLLGIFFVYAGVSCYFTIIWKKYTNENSAVKVIGDVLSSEPSSSSTTTTIQHNNGKYYNVSVLYTTTIHKYENDSRNKFRYPNAIKHQRYLRKFTVNEPIPWGSRIDVYVLHGMPRSGCIREVIDTNICNHSHCRTCLILVPGVCLVGIFAYLTMVELYAMEGDDDQKETILQWTAVCAVLLVLLSCTNMWCQRRFQRELEVIFQGGIPQRTIIPSSQSSSQQGRADDDSYNNNSQNQQLGSMNTRNNDRTQPLLPPSLPNDSVDSGSGGRGRKTSASGPLHQKGMNVFYLSSGSTITPARILDVHLDDELEPYYTIRLEDGREKQTDNDHILLLV